RPGRAHERLIANERRAEPGPPGPLHEMHVLAARREPPGAKAGHDRFRRILRETPSRLPPEAVQHAGGRDHHGERPQHRAHPPEVGAGREERVPTTLAMPKTWLAHRERPLVWTRRGAASKS